MLRLINLKQMCVSLHIRKDKWEPSRLISQNLRQTNSLLLLLNSFASMILFLQKYKTQIGVVRLGCVSCGSTLKYYALVFRVCDFEYGKMCLMIITNIYLNWANNKLFQPILNRFETFSQYCYFKCHFVVCVGNICDAYSITFPKM